MRRAASALVLLLLSAAAAPAQDLFPGWTAGPAADATMDKGRRFDCTGGACPPSGLSCLYAAAPHTKGQRVVPTSDLMRRKGVPWKDIEAWLAAKLTVLRPDLAGTPAADAKTWTVTEPSRLENGDRFLAKRYALAGPSVTVALWMTDGAMNVLVCAVKDGEEGAAWGRVAGLVEGM